MTPTTTLAPPRPRAFFSRWQLALIFATALVAANGVAWFVFHVKARAAQRGAAETHQEDASTNEGGASRPQDGDDQPGRTKQGEDAKADREAAEALRPALGLVTTIGIRQAYLNVGVLADAVEGEVYETAEAVKVLDQVEADLTAVDRQLGELMQKVFEASDRKAVGLARQALQLIRTQARELRAHWDSNTKESAERFQKARAASWEAIKELLEVDD
jgi:hypothetical protein